MYVQLEKLMTSLETYSYDNCLQSRLKPNTYHFLPWTATSEMYTVLLGLNFI